jgi:hypothetical protein
VTQVLPRPTTTSAQRPAPTPPGVAPLWVRAAFAAIWAVTVGLASLVVVVLAMWAADTRSAASAGATARFAVVVWLSAMHVPMHVSSGGTVSLAPLGLSVVVLLLLARASTIVARGQRDPSLRDAARVVGLVVAPYTVLCVVLAVVARSSSITPSLPWTVVAAVLTGSVAAGAGVARGCGVGRVLWAQVPRDLRIGAGAAGAGGAVLALVATLLLVGSLALHPHPLTHSLHHYGGGISTEVSLVVVCLVLLPNAVMSALGYLAGPGFALGAGTSYSMAGVHTGRLPSLPLLAARPDSGAASSVVALCVVALLLAGLVTGWRLVRREGDDLWARLRQVAMAGAVAGVVTAVLVAVAAGSVGPGQLSAIGASPWQIGMSVAGELMLPAAVVVVTWTWVLRIPAVAALPATVRERLAMVRERLARVRP